LIGEDIELVALLDPDVGQVKADPGQIEQVLMNLVINGRDAMPNGGRITIRTKNAELTQEGARQYHYVQPGRYVLIEVSDTGCGMDAETLSRVFEPFFTTKQPGKGTGLGLATVYGIVKQSGGYIWASSEPGKGATFQIYLPLTEEAPLDGATLEKAPSSAGREVVLLVEDEDELRTLLRDTLKKAGYTVLEAANGSDALQVSKEHQGPIHAVVTDMVMPRLGGRSLVKRLAESRPEMLVLYMSGHFDDATIRRDGLESGVHFLQKPFEPALLTSKIRGLLDQKVAR
jgi:CheY-like chemotaxis protein